jgi:hypothetical protein
MRTLNQNEIMHVSGGIEGTASGSVGCTTSTTTKPDGTKIETTTCVATITIKVE